MSFTYKFRKYLANTKSYDSTVHVIRQMFPHSPTLSQYIPGVQGVSAELPFGQKFPTVHRPPWATSVGRATVAPAVQNHPPSQSPVGMDSPVVWQYLLQQKIYIIIKYQSHDIALHNMKNCFELV